MKELGLALLGSFSIFGFFATVVYPDLEYTGYSSTHNCTGECYEEYVRVNGTTVEIEQRKREIANADEFSSIRSLWSGCAACHGQEGVSPSSIWPNLAGQHASYLSKQLYEFKKGADGNRNNSIMYGISLALSDEDISNLSAYYASLKSSVGTTPDE